MQRAKKWHRAYLLRARAGKSLTSSSVDMSSKASRSTPLQLNFLNVLFFGWPEATSASTSACKSQGLTKAIENNYKIHFSEEEEVLSPLLSVSFRRLKPQIDFDAGGAYKVERRRTMFWIQHKRNLQGGTITCITVKIIYLQNYH